MKSRPTRVLPLACGIALLVQACSSVAPGGPPSMLSDGPLKPLTASLLQLGDEAQKRSDFAAAAGFYRRARDEEPDARAPLLRLGVVLIDLQAYKQALELFRQAQASMPDDPEVAFRLGELYLKSGDALAAIDQFETALKTRRDDPRVFNAIGVAYSMQHRYDLALKYYREGLRIAPDQARLLNNLAVAQYLAGDSAHAVQTLSSLADRPDATPRQRQNLALLGSLRDRAPGDRNAEVGVHFAGDAGSPPTLAASRPEPAATLAAIRPEPAPAMPREARISKPSPPVPTPASTPALPVEPVQTETALATALNAIRPTEAPRPTAAELPAPPVAAQAAPSPGKPLPPSRPVAFRAPEEPYAARFFYCVRSATPIDRDTAERHWQIAHTAFAIAPQIYRFRAKIAPNDEVTAPDPAPARYTVQFVAFASEGNAIRFVEQLERSGVAAKVVSYPRNDRPQDRPVRSPTRVRAEPDNLDL